MAELYILNRHDELLGTISEETGLLSALFREELNRVPDEPFTFTVDASAENAQYVIEENQVVFRDKEEELRLYVIKEIDDEHGDNPQVTATCEPAFLELKEHIVVERRFVDQDAQRALDAALEGTRWKGTVELELGQGTTNFYYISAVDAVWKVLNTWGGELKDVVTFDGNRIVKREIRILARRGIDSGKRFEIGHNVEEIKRTVLSYPVTALYGRGASLQNEDDEGNATGGYSRYIDFSDIEWKKSKGDPVDKPRGQKWVGSPQALHNYGRMNDGKLLHREAIWQNSDIEDPKLLLEKTWEQLQEVSKPEVNYQLSVRLLEHIAGYEHERVSLGDTARAFDRNFSRPIEMQARVITVEYDLLDIEGSAVVEMGQFLTLPDANTRIDKVEAELNDKRRQWDAGSDVIIDASKYPDIVPLVSVVTVEGLFAAIKVDWEYNYLDTYIAGHEVYISEVKDFIPSSETMVWRGYGNSYSYHGEVNKQYYVRVRAFNYHSRYSDFSEEVTATTHRVIDQDILFNEELAKKLQSLSERAQIIAENALEGKSLMDDSILADKIAKYAITNDHIYDISGDKIRANTIAASRLAIGDMTNLTQIQADGDAGGYQVVSWRVGDRHLNFIRSEGQYGQIRLSRSIKNDFRVGDKYRLNMMSRLDNGAEWVRLYVRAYYTDDSWNNLGEAQVKEFKDDLTSNVGCVIEIMNEIDFSKTLSHVDVLLQKNKDPADGWYQIRDIQLSRMYAGELIVDGSITTNKIAANSVTANHFEADALVAGIAAIDKAVIGAAHIKREIVDESHIKDLAVTKGKIGELAVDTVNIAKGAVTDAKISNLDASKITSGFIDAANIAIMAKGSKDNDRQVIKMDKDGLHSYDDKGKLRILLGVTNYKDGSPAVIRFFDERQRNMGYIGANVENTLALTSTGHMHVESGGSGKKMQFYSNEFTFQPWNAGTKDVSHWVMGRDRRETIDGIGGNTTPTLRPDKSGQAQIGLQNFRIWVVNTNYVRYLKKLNFSSQETKENIQVADVDEYASLFDHIQLKTFNRKRDDIEATLMKKELGVIAEEMPTELTEENTYVDDGMVMYATVAKIKSQQTQIDYLKEALAEIKREMEK
ncbi:phage tail spike protein [Bacillus sp. FSL W7-1360]